MGCLDAVKFLLPYEIGLLTQKEVAIPSPGFSTQAKYKLVSGSTCLTIALLRGAGEVVKYIVRYVEDNPSAQAELLGKLDDEQMCTYLMGTICTFKEAIEFLKNDLFIEKEFFLCQTGDMTPVMNAAFFGRPQFAQIILDLSKDKRYREGIYRMALQRDSGDATCLDLSLAEVDYVKYGCTVDDKKKVYQIFRELCMNAYDYAQKNGWTALLQTFTRGMTKEAIFGKTVESPKKSSKDEGEKDRKHKARKVESSDEESSKKSDSESSYSEYSQSESEQKPKKKAKSEHSSEGSDDRKKDKKKGRKEESSDSDRKKEKKHKKKEESSERSESSDEKPAKKEKKESSSSEYDYSSYDESS